VIKEKTESLMMTVIALLAFIILAIYLITQDVALVGPI